MNKDLMFSSDSGEWDTPQDLIDDLAQVFDWNLDVCASRPNVCSNYYSLDRGQNALELPWEGDLWWCNFPYGRGSFEWINKGVKSVRDNGGVGVFISPARTDTKATQYLMNNSNLVVFISGRLVFGSDQSWVTRHEKSMELSQKKAVAAIKKVGGKLIKNRHVLNMLKIDWSDYDVGFSFDEWMEMDYLKKDAAPFPSMLAVVGHGLTEKQAKKLSSYGVVATIE